MSTQTPEYWRKSSQSFDTVAEAYDAYRPGYPPDLFDTIFETARLTSKSRLLEIGTGTGQATRPFAERGCSILCLEPGVNLAAVAARNLMKYPGIRFALNRFEDWLETPEEFDLVFSAQAFHWVPWETGIPKAARVLKPGGYLALIWNLYPGGVYGPLDADLQKAYDEFAPEISTPVTRMEDTIRERAGWIEAGGGFGPVAIQRFPWSLCYTTQQYLGLLNTYSDHIHLPAETRGNLYQAIGQAIDRYGGRLERPYVAVLFLAQKPSH
jgi:SAM-dependent methyltransferase